MNDESLNLKWHLPLGMTEQELEDFLKWAHVPGAIPVTVHNHQYKNAVWQSFDERSYKLFNKYLKEKHDGI